MKKAPKKELDNEELYPHKHQVKYSRERKIMQVETHLLTAAVVFLAEAVISMLIRGICKKINRRKQLCLSREWILTKGSSGFIGGEYVKGVK